jgi:uncharacterized membrane protein YkvA (DUF1232 family)
LETLLDSAQELYERIACDQNRHPRLKRQVNVAFDIVRDHVKGSSPQIPYFTVALLGAALYYLLRPVDVVPDLLLDIGASDDALMLQIAFDSGRPGVERYCAWKGEPSSGLFSGD